MIISKAAPISSWHTFEQSYDSFYWSKISLLYKIEKIDHESVGSRKDIIEISQPELNLLLLPSDGCLKWKKSFTIFFTIFLKSQYISNCTFKKYFFNFLFLTWWKYNWRKLGILLQKSNSTLCVAWWRRPNNTIAILRN